MENSIETKVKALSDKYFTVKLPLYGEAKSKKKADPAKLNALAKKIRGSLIYVE